MESVITTMSRTEALVKLLSIGELTEPEAWVICGWPREEFSKVLRDALKSDLIYYQNIGRGMRVYKSA